MPRHRNLYTFNGLVYIDGCNAGRYKAEVVAVSKAQGLNMLRYRYKKEHNIDQYTQVVLDGQMTFIEEID